MNLVFESLDEVMTQNFNREGTPFRKMGIGSERNTQMVKDFLEVVFNAANLTPEKFLNVGEDIIIDKHLEGFRELVNTWPKYERLMYSVGLNFDRKWGNKPGIEETIFKILPGFETKKWKNV